MRLQRAHHPPVSLPNGECNWLDAESALVDLNQNGTQYGDPVVGRFSARRGVGILTRPASSHDIVGLAGRDTPSRPSTFIMF